MTSHALLPARQHGLSCLALGAPTVTIEKRPTKTYFVATVLVGFIFPFMVLALPTLHGIISLTDFVQFTAGLVFGEILAIVSVLRFVPERNPFRAPSGAKKRG